MQTKAASLYRRNMIVFCGETFTGSETRQMGIVELIEHCSARQKGGYSHFHRPFKDEESAREWLARMAGSCGGAHTAYLVTEEQFATDKPITEMQRKEGVKI